MVTKDDLLKMYAQMVLGRRYMENIIAYVKRGKLVGFFHLGPGQEAISAAILHVKKESDYIVPTHRQQTLLVNLLDTDKFTCELIGKANGYCKGLGFEFHISSTEKHLFPISAVLGSSIPMGVGAAMALKMDKKNAVVICCLGEGAASEGNVHEAMNIAADYKLPVVFMVENNGWAISQPAERQNAAVNVSARSAGYNMPGVTVDGSDLLQVIDALQEAVDRARTDFQPSIVEARLERWRGHFEGDPQPYRTAEEIEAARSKDCILKLEKILMDEHKILKADLEKIDADAVQKVEGAFAYADESRLPSPEEIFDPANVYVTPMRGLEL